MHFFRSKDDLGFGLKLRVLILLVIGVVMLPKECVGQDDAVTEVPPPPLEEKTCVLCAESGPVPKCEDTDANATTTKPPMECKAVYCYDHRTDGQVIQRGCWKKADFKEPECFLKHLGSCKIGSHEYPHARSKAYQACLNATGARQVSSEDNFSGTCYCHGELCNAQKIVKTFVTDPPGNDTKSYAGTMTALDNFAFLTSLLVGVIFYGLGRW